MALFVGENKRTPETVNVERVFRENGFENSEAYRHSSASIRLRVIDERFRKLSRVARIELLEPIIEKLPEETQQDLIFVIAIAPGEEKGEFMMMNLEFDDPSRPRF